MCSHRRPAFDLENSPPSLLYIAARRIILDKIDFSHISLPQELYNLLMQVYRDEYHYETNPANLSRFLAQFSGRNHRLTECNVSGLLLTDSDIARLFMQHSRHMNSLDISDCPNLSHTTIVEWVHSLSTVTDLSKLCRTIYLKRKNMLDESESLLFIQTYDKNSLKWGIEENPTPPTEFWLPKPQLRSLMKECCLHSNVLLHKFFIDFIGDEISTHLKSGIPSNRHSECDDGKVVRIVDAQWKVQVENFEYTLAIDSWQKPSLTALNLGDARRFMLASYLCREGFYDRCFALFYQLKWLSIHHLPVTPDVMLNPSFLTQDLHFLHSLEYLDLSHCRPLGSGKVFPNFKNLKVLILYNVPKLDVTIPSIAQISSLRYLDISASIDQYGHRYKDPQETLSLISQGLPNLTHLDISGTNLAGPLHEYIIGLSNRYDRPFEFLGLYQTSNEAAHRPHIPAIRVAGNATDEQTLVACEEYIHRLQVFKKTLTDLFVCLRVENDFKDSDRALAIVLAAMKEHLNEMQIQITATASLFYLVKHEDNSVPFNLKVRRMIIKSLLDVMHKHNHDITILRNAGLTLVHFKIPQDVLFEYSRLVQILLLIVSKEEDEFVQRLGVVLLNTLACHVEGEQRLLVCNLGAISKMLTLIASKLEKGECDEVMETAWSLMWNVTDETPVNCERFLECDGMNYFMGCVAKFPSKNELLRNMMGLLGNVAECPDLRRRLMRDNYINCFTQMLSSTTQGIEISYNAAGILAHIVSDGESVWKFLLPSTDRSRVLAELNRAISSWAINSERTINYRSFEPILRLLSPRITSHEAQYWAIFALVNLTRVRSEKYCDLFIKADGERIVTKLLEQPNLPDHIINYARITLAQVERYRKYGTLIDLVDNSSRELSAVTEGITS